MDGVGVLAVADQDPGCPVEGAEFIEPGQRGSGGDRGQVGVELDDGGAGSATALLTLRLGGRLPTSGAGSGPGGLLRR